MTIILNPALDSHHHAEFEVIGDKIVTDADFFTIYDNFSVARVELGTIYHNTAECCYSAAADNPAAADTATCRHSGAATPT